ncbi:MAG: hypothetical protein WD872_08060 [Pirellulaceae bacterium]
MRLGLTGIPHVALKLVMKWSYTSRPLTVGGGRFSQACDAQAMC